MWRPLIVALGLAAALIALVVSANAQVATPATSTSTTPFITGEIALKSLRIKQDGGVRVSGDPILYVNGTIPITYGFYANGEVYLAQNEKPDQFTVTLGEKFAYHGLNVNVYGQWWFLPRKDAYYLVTDVSYPFKFDNGDSLTALARFGRLQCFGQKQTYIFRGILTWNSSLLGVPFQAAGGIADRTDNDHLHSPLTLSVPLNKLFGFIPDSVPLSVGGEALFPWRADKRSFAAVLSTKWSL